MRHKIFDNSEFQSLDYDTKVKTVNNYFDKKLSNDEFLTLPKETQTQAKENFLNEQLDFDISDTYDKHIAPIVENEEKTDYQKKFDTKELQYNDTTPDDWKEKISTDLTALKDKYIDPILHGSKEDFKSKEFNFSDEVIEPFKASAKDVAHNDLMSNAIIALGDDANDPVKLEEYLANIDKIYGNNPVHLLQKEVADMDVKEHSAKHNPKSVIEAFKKEGLASVDAWLEVLKAVPSVTAGSLPHTAAFVVNLPQAIKSYGYKLAKDSLEQDGETREPNRTEYTEGTMVASVIGTLDKFGFSKASDPLKQAIASAVVKDPSKKITDVVKSFKDTTVNGIKYELPTELLQENLEVAYIKDEDLTGDDLLEASVGAVLGTAGMTTGIAGAKEIVNATADAINESVKKTPLSNEEIKAKLEEGIPSQGTVEEIKEPLDQVEAGFKELEEELFNSSKQAVDDLTPKGYEDGELSKNIEKEHTETPKDPAQESFTGENQNSRDIDTGDIQTQTTNKELEKETDENHETDNQENQDLSQSENGTPEIQVENFEPIGNIGSFEVKPINKESMIKELEDYSKYVGFTKQKDIDNEIQSMLNIIEFDPETGLAIRVTAPNTDKKLVRKEKENQGEEELENKLGTLDKFKELLQKNGTNIDSIKLVESEKGIDVLSAKTGKKFFSINQQAIENIEPYKKDEEFYQSTFKGIAKDLQKQIDNDTPTPANRPNTLQTVWIDNHRYFLVNENAKVDGKKRVELASEEIGLDGKVEYKSIYLTPASYKKKKITIPEKDKLDSNNHNMYNTPYEDVFKALDIKRNHKTVIYDEKEWFVDKDAELDYLFGSVNLKETENSNTAKVVKLKDIELLESDTDRSNSYMEAPEKPKKKFSGLQSFIAKAKAIKNRLVKYKVEDVSTDEKQELSEKFNFKKPENIKRVINNYQIRHIFKSHGDQKSEESRGNKAITEEDILNYPNIIHNADMKIYSENKNGTPTIVYGKQLDKEYYVLVEEVRTGKHELSLHTMRITKGTLSEGDLMLSKDKPQSQHPNMTPPASKGIDTLSENDTRSSTANETIISNTPNKSQGTKIDPVAYDDTDSKNLYSQAGSTVGVNYIATYGATGLPTRPKDGTISIGERKVDLPTLIDPINADSLRVYASDIIGNRLYQSKIKNKSALGVYKRDDSSIRVKNYSDVEVIAHELAHYLDFFYKNTTKKASGSYFRKAIIKNKNEVKSVSYTTDPKKELSEGFAEFVRLWLTNYNAINQVAPRMVKDFEKRLASDKSLNKKMIQLQEGMHKYYYQGQDVILRSKRGGKLDTTAKKIQRSQQQIAKDMRQKAIDKIHTIKIIEADINGDIAHDTIESPYKLLQMVNGASSVMYSTMNFGVPTVDENGDLTYSGKALNDIFEPATSVSEERVRLLEDFLVAKRSSELMEQGRENLITKEEIEVGLQLAQTYPEFETIFEEYQEFNDAMLDFYVDMNLITEDQKSNFQEFNKNYVPFHRITESVQYGEVPPSRIGQRLTGGTHSLGNIMENIIEGLENNIKEAMISRGKSVFYKMLEDSGMGGVYATKIATDNKKVKVDLEAQAKAIAKVMGELGITVSKDGMLISGELESEQVIDTAEIEANLLANPETMEFWTHGHKPTSKTGYIDSVIIDGKLTYFETNDAGLVDALTSFRSSHYNDVVQGLMQVKNIMTWNITNNPLFYLANFARDTVSASVLSKNKFKPMISSLNGMYHFITKSKTYKEFMASGAGYGTMRTNLGSDIESMQMLKVNRGLDLVNRTVSALEYGADVFEYGTRVGDFALAKEQGKSNLSAGFEAREVSTDFAIKGSSKALTGFLATVPFMKAGINGIDKTARRIATINGEMKLSNMVKFRNAHDELVKHKIKLYATGGMIAMGTLALFMQNKDDERYKKLTKDQKLMYWNFFLEDGTHIKVPRPYDIGFIFSGIPEIAMNYLYDKDGEKALEEFAWSLKTMFSVGDVSGLFQPIMDDLRNKNWTDSPIVPVYLENLDDKSEQYLESTPLIYKELGELTGISPLKADHYASGYFGLTTKMIEELTENLLWDKKQWGARPFAKDPLEFMTYRFKGKEVEPRTIWSEKYYKLVQKSNSIKNSFEKKKQRAYKDNAEDVKEYIADEKNQTYVHVARVLRKYRSVLADIKTNAEHIYYDKKLTKATKEKKINEMYTMKTELFEKLVTDIESKIEELEREDG